MNSVRFFLPLVIFAFFGCQKDKSDPLIGREKELIGSWEGVLSQVGYPNFTIEVDITKIKIGEKAGEGSYSNPPCEFRWTYRSNQNDKLFEFSEVITTPNSDCVNGRVTLLFIDNDRLQLNWYGVDHPDNQAEGVLRRR